SLGQPQQDLRRHRALVALYQVDVARRNPKTLGDLGLRQAQLLADAPESRTDKQLFSGVTRHGSLADWNARFLGPDSTKTGRPSCSGGFSSLNGQGECDKNDNLTDATCLYVTSHHQ